MDTIPAMLQPVGTPTYEIMRATHFVQQTDRFIIFKKDVPKLSLESCAFFSQNRSYFGLALVSTRVWKDLHIRDSREITRAEISGGGKKGSADDCNPYPPRKT